MSGGLAYVYDENGDFADKKCNRAGVDLESLVQTDEVNRLHVLISRHAELTGSQRAQQILDNWSDAITRFIKVFPHDYKRVLGIPLTTSAALRSQARYQHPPAAANAL
jgi:glutamate synthase domain-containing protein 3